MDTESVTVPRSILLDMLFDDHHCPKCGAPVPTHRLLREDIVKILEKNKGGQSNEPTQLERDR